MSTEKCQSELIESANWVRGFFDEESRFKAADASVSILLTEYRQAAYHAARLAKIALFDGKSRDKAIYAEAAARTLERALSLMLVEGPYESMANAWRLEEPIDDIS